MGKFSEQYPNGMRRTYFMTKLKGGRFVYRDNLGGLCSTCNDCGYLVFGNTSGNFEGVDLHQYTR